MKRIMKNIDITEILYVIALIILIGLLIIAIGALIIGLLPKEESTTFWVMQNTFNTLRILQMI